MKPKEKLKRLDIAYSHLVGADRQINEILEATLITDVVLEDVLRALNELRTKIGRMADELGAHHG